MSASTTTSGGAMTEDEIQVDIPIGHDDVGRVIGKSGVHIRLVRERSQCQIEMVTAGPFVRIKGPHKGVEIAKRLIAEVAGGQGVVFLRDLSDAAYRELNTGGWLLNEAHAAGVAAELRGRVVRICSNSQATSLNFKQIVERKLNEQLGLIRTTVDCFVAEANAAAESTALKSLVERFGLRIERRPRAQGRCTLILTGPQAIVNEAQAQAQFFANEGHPTGRRTWIPFWPNVLLTCPPEKLADLRADVHEAVEQRFGVTVNLQQDNQLVTVDGELSVEAAVELREILQYYFNNSCALMCMPMECLHACDVPLGSPDLAVECLTNGNLWLSGAPAVVTARCQALCRAAVQWQCNHALVPLPHHNCVPVVLGRNRERARKIFEATGATVSPHTLGNAATAICVSGPSSRVVEEGRQKVLSVLLSGEA